MIPMDQPKIALITGASSGIGMASARWFAEQGWSLVLWARRIERLRELQGALMQQVGYRLEIWVDQVDVRSDSQVQRAFASLPSSLQNVDLLLNNAGLSQGLNAVHESNPEDADRVLDTNIKGLVNVSRAVVPGMKMRGNGQVIHVSSTAGKEVYPGGGIYCASKFAVEAIAKTMRHELLPFGIKVGTVSPGMVETEFSLVRFKGDADRAAGTYQGLEPLHPEDVAEAIGFMASRPDHVQIADLLLMPRAQAGSGAVHRVES
jgi:NADP-dependent 3-hydroxy acid dehydrogenase YdfG